jgi:hypothetical protein
MYTCVRFVCVDQPCRTAKPGSWFKTLFGFEEFDHRHLSDGLEIFTNETVGRNRNFFCTFLSDNVVRGDYSSACEWKADFVTGFGAYSLAAMQSNF